MSTDVIELLDTYVGMPDTMQGGYVAGIAAGSSDGPVRVRIRKATHPGQHLTRVQDNDSVQLFRDSELVMSVVPDALHVTPRSPLPREAIDEAVARPMAWEPPYPTCIGCGHEVDGLGVERSAHSEMGSTSSVYGPLPLNGRTIRELFLESLSGLHSTA